MSIEIKNLSHIYSEGMPYQTTALSDINMKIPDNSFVGIIGHTGSGKSTLIQHFNGLLKPKTGQIIVNQIDITAPGIKLMEIRKMIGLVFQYPEYQLFEETVKQDIAFGPLNLGLSKEEVDIRVKEAMDLVGLSYMDLGDRSPFELSGGQKRRVAIAGVIAMRPQVLILDEPTAGLDPQAHKDILKLIKKVHESGNNTIILVSHNMGDIAELSDMVFVMEKGRLLLSGTPQEVFSKTKILKEIGLGLPPASELFERIEEKCGSSPNQALSLSQAEDEIVKWISKSGETSC